MIGHTLASVFANAAVPQKIVLVVLLGALLAVIVGASLVLLGKRRDGALTRLIADFRVVGPALGLLVGAMNAFHMAQSIQRAPFDPTAKQLAPGILEVSVLVGLVAAGAHAALRRARSAG